MVLVLKIRPLQMNIWIRCCSHFKIPGAYFAGERRIFIASTYHCSLQSTVLNKPWVMLFVGSLDSTRLMEAPSDSNIQDSLHYNLKSHQHFMQAFVYLFIITDYLFMSERGKSYSYSHKGKQFKWKKEENHRIFIDYLFKSM